MINPTVTSGKSGRVGTAGEMLVAADLLNHGYEVYKAVSGHAGCDLVADISGHLYRVEVKTVGRDSSGNSRSASNYKHKPLDILATVDTATKEIRYQVMRQGIEDVHLSNLPFAPLPVHELLLIRAMGVCKAVEQFDYSSLEASQRDYLIDTLDKVAAYLEECKALV